MSAPTPAFNAGDAACSAPGSTPTVLTNSGGLSGRMYANWTGDTANNGLSSPLSAPQISMVKSICYQFAKAIAQELAADMGTMQALNAGGATLGTNVGSYGSGYDPGRWRVNPFNEVLVQATLAITGAIGSGGTLFTLPVGARPGYSLQINGKVYTGSDGWGLFNMNANGTLVTNVALANGNNVSLCFTFLAEN